MGAGVEQVESWPEPGLWFSPASITKGRESKGFQSVCKGVIVMIGYCKNGRKWVRGLKNCWNQRATGKYGNMRWCSEYDTFETVNTKKWLS